MCLRVSQISTCESGDFILDAYRIQVSFRLCAVLIVAVRAEADVGSINLLNHACPTDGISVNLGVCTRLAVVTSAECGVFTLWRTGRDERKAGRSAG